MDTRKPEWNPLFSAIQGRHIEIVKVFLRKGIDTRVKYTDESGKVTDAYSYARDLNELEIADLLLHKNIREGIRHGDVEGVMALMDSKQLKAMTVFGTWLHVAADFGQMEIVKRLIDMGADINVQWISRGTAIHSAAREGHIEIVKYLIDRGAKLDFPDPTSNPLFGAILGGHMEIVKLLIDRGIDAKVKYMSDYGQERDARSFAIERKQNAIAALLANIP